jgi:hypothetical protein
MDQANAVKTLNIVCTATGILAHRLDEDISCETPYLEPANPSRA